MRYYIVSRLTTVVGMEPRPIPETLGFLIAQVCKAHRYRASVVLGEVGLHVGQEMILLHLWENEGLTQSELADRLAVEPPTVTKMLRRMEGCDLVERRADAEDARVSRVYLTARGRALEAPVLAAWDQLEHCTRTSLTLEEQILLRRLLLQVRQNLT